MKFVKMHGAGNDFIIINNIEEQIPQEKMSGIAKKLCERRTSIGADGLMFIEKPEAGGDFKMIFYNCDGSLGEMCGNASRCVSRYGYDNGLSGETQCFEATAGIIYGWRVSERMYRVRLNDPSVIDLHRTVKLGNDEYDISYIELGNPGLPHGILLFDELDRLDQADFRELGASLRYAPEFPKGANITFCKVIGKDDVLAVTYERGVEDFTLACGTGSGSTAAALTLRGLVSGKDVKIGMPGGDLYITLKNENGNISDIFLTGPTNLVAVGEVMDEDLVV